MELDSGPRFSTGFEWSIHHPLYLREGLETEVLGGLVTVFLPPVGMCLGRVQ